MEIPWDDEVVATLDTPDGPEILVRAPLRIAVPYLADRIADRQRIRLVFPTRSERPYEYHGRDIGWLFVELYKTPGSRPGS